MNEKIKITIDLFMAGKRVDGFVASEVEGVSRQYAQKLIDMGAVLVDGKTVKHGYKLKEGDRITVELPPLKALEIKPVKMNLDILYEDKDVVVINKPAGLVVHPGVDGTHAEDSLVSGLMAHCGDSLSGINGVLRPGIVHRLDKDTSGVLICAKNDKAHRFLAEQFEGREVEKVYLALIAGIPEANRGMIEAPIGRSRGDRKKMDVTSERNGKMAVTKYVVLESFGLGNSSEEASGIGSCSLVQVRILTGRTHQIRVHFSSIGHPVVGDTVYGDLKLNTFFEQEYGLGRIFLHAFSLGIKLPSSKASKSGDKEKSVFETDLPDALKTVLDKLKPIL